MSRLSRRQLLGSTVATAAAVTLGVPAVHAQKRGGTLRFVAEADLKVAPGARELIEAIQGNRDPHSE